MLISIKRIVINRLSLKAISLLLGYSLWSILSHNQTIRITITVPLCFYNIEHNLTIDAPETIAITLEGKRELFKYGKIEMLAAHIDCMTLHEGIHRIDISSQTLFLPDYIKLIHYNPSPLLITLTC